jgi:hypothetical protein
MRIDSQAEASHSYDLAKAPEELTTGRLRRLGEGIGKVVYASDHWVVKRERSGAEVIALIVIWKLLHRLSPFLPGGVGDRYLQRPSRLIRFCRVLMQGIVHLVPRGFWMASHVGEVWRVYTMRDERGEDLADTYLAGTALIPRRVQFPPTRVRIGGWPGWLTVSEATERVEDTLHRRLTDLARAGKFDEVERWLERFLARRQSGWQRGLFSVDAHLKNFGVMGDKVVLLDAGGLTDRWEEIEERLSYEDVAAEPHIQLGLGPLLGSRPDIAERFNARWRSTVNLEAVKRHWPDGTQP